MSRTLYPGQQILDIQSGNDVFSASLRHDAAAVLLSSLENGSVVRVTGIAAIQYDTSTIPYTPISMRLLMRSPRDLVVIKRPPWWNLKYTLLAIGSLSVMILGAISWVGLLKR